jgi:transcriptional regulator with XRE-family HTH domain
MDILQSDELQMTKLRSIAERLRLAREHSGLDQQQFADRIGFSRRQIVAWESASNVPPIWALQAIRDHCDIDPEWVLNGPGDVPLVDVSPELRSRSKQIRHEVERLIQDAGMILPEESIKAIVSLVEMAPSGSEREAKKHIKMLLSRVSGAPEKSHV